MIAIGKKRRSRNTRIISLASTCGLIALSVIQVPRLADQTEDIRTKIAQHHELKTGLRVSDSAAEITAQLNDVNNQLEILQASMIDSSQLPNVQSELLDMARSSGCQIRKVAIQPGLRENWAPQSASSPEEQSEDNKDLYSLNTEQISLSLNGTFEQTALFIAKIRQKPWMMRVAHISFSHLPEETGRLTVEATLAFVRLAKSEDEGEFVNWREGSRAARIH